MMRFVLAFGFVFSFISSNAQIPSPTGINGSTSLFTGGPLGTAISTVTVTPPTVPGCVEYGINYQSNLNGFYVTTTGTCVTPFGPASMWSNPVLSGGNKTVTMTMPSTSVSGCVGIGTRTWTNPTLTVTITSTNPAHVWSVNTGTGVISAPVSFGGGSLVFTVNETINGSGGAQVNSVDLSGCSSAFHECSSLNWGWFNGVAPANDNCGNAINIAALPFSSTVTSNACATDDGPTSTCTSGAPFKNLWYKVTGICGTMTASTCSGNTNFDTEIAVFSGTNCGGLTSVACNNDNGVSCAGTKASLTWTATAGTTYWISVGSPTNGSQTGSFQLDVTANPFSSSVAPTGITGTTSICNGSSTTLTVAGGSLGTGAVWQWYTGSCGGTLVGTGTSITVAPGTTTTYFVRASGTCNTTSCAAQAVTVNPVVNAGIIVFSSANPICSGDLVTFFGFPSNGGTSPTYQWQVNGINVGTNNSNYATNSIANGDVVTCIMTSNAACVTGNPATSSPITMVVNPSLPVSVSVVASDTTICPGTTVNFLALPNNGGSSPAYQWKINGLNVGTNNPFFSSSTLNNGDLVTCTLTSNAGCATGNPATSAPITMVVALPPTPTITPPGAASFCTGGSITLSSSAPSGNVWSNGATTQTITVSAAGSYDVYAVVSGCTSLVSIPTVVTENPIPPTPSITAAGPTTFCNGSNVILTSSATTGNVWSNGDVTQSTTISASGTYTVFQIAAGCTSAVSAPVTVTVNPIPATPVITPSGATTFCAGGNVTLSSTGTTGHNWSTGATTSSINVTAAGTYTVYVVELGCTSNVSIPAVVTVNPIPATPTITASGATTFCPGDSVTLTSSGPTGNNWSTGATSQSINVNAAGAYTVFVVELGCTSLTSLPTVITVNPIPATPTITASGPTTFCAGGSVTLTSSGITGNQWSNGATTQTINVLNSGVFTVYVVELGCTSAVSLPTTITVNPIPATPTITASGPATFCDGDSVILSSSAGSGNFWSNGATTVSTTITASGSYTVYEVALGCTSATSLPMIVTVNPIPVAPVITAGGPVSFCAGDSVTLTSNYTNGNTWSNGATTQNITVNTAGSYSTFVVELGCTSSVSLPVNITVNPIPPTPTITATGATAFCAGDSVTLFSSAPTGNAWSNGDTANSTTIHVAGSYTVVEVALGCSSAVSAPLVVTVNPIPSTPVITASGSTTFCAGDSVTLTSSNPNGNNWSNGATSPSITVSTGGTFTDYVIESGCTSAVSLPVMVTVNPIPAAPTISASGPTTFCEGDSVTLSSNSLSGNLWSNGATSQTIVTTIGGTFTANVVALGCTSTTSNAILVIVNPAPAPPTITQSGNLLTANPASVSYQWYLNGNLIPGATGQSYTATQSGNYTVVSTDANGCSSSQSVMYVFTGRNSELAEAMTLAPNPSSGRFRLKARVPWLDDAMVKVINMEGKTIHSIQLQDLNGLLDTWIELPSVANGMYFLQFETETETMQLKLIKE